MGITKQTLFAAAVQYVGDTQTWNLDSLQQQIVYPSDITQWHYFELVMDYDKKEYVSFQWDDEVWDLHGEPIFIGPGFFSPIPAPPIAGDLRDERSFGFE